MVLHLCRILLSGLFTKREITIICEQDCLSAIIITISSLKYVNYEENDLPHKAHSHFIHLLLRNFLLQTLFKRSGCILGPLVPHLPG